jgi:membrane-associated protein
MDIAHFLLDFILHVDAHLAEFVQTYGLWVYGLLFLIIFVETGLVVMPFLPGDSLLFVVGTLCGTGAMSLPVAIGVLLVAAIAGDQLNYTLGRLI